MSSFAARRKDRIKREYSELRESDPDLFRHCVQNAEGIVLNRCHALGLNDSQRLDLMAAIEGALVSIALEAKAGQP